MSVERLNDDSRRLSREMVEEGIIAETSEPDMGKTFSLCLRSGDMVEQFCFSIRFF